MSGKVSRNTPSGILEEILPGATRTISPDGLRVILSEVIQVTSHVISRGITLRISRRISIGVPPEILRHFFKDFCSLNT